MTELSLLPVSNNGSYFYTTVLFLGSGYTSAALYAKFDGDGKLWVEISVNGTDWFILEGSTVDVYGSDLFPLQNFSPILYYRIATTTNPITIKIIS